MAKPLAWTPAPVDPRKELIKQLETAPHEHAEALLEAYATLQTAHDKGILSLAKGLIGGKDIIAGELGKGMKSTEGVNAIRNGIAMARLLAAFDPDLLQKFAQSMEEHTAETKQEEKPPSLWKLFKSATSEDGRRGIAFATGMLTSLGKATRK